MTPAEQAREGINAYLKGSYFMSALNTKGMKLLTNGHLVTFEVSDIADKVCVITANGRTEYENTNTINYNANYDDVFIRFEAYWNDSGEFIYTNPVWVENVQ
jgi:nitroimidazol reductase NimA-like FMN-containing flavoprotein (pyridoxamine 5'-phosphate oxidase superfamily)